MRHILWTGGWDSTFRVAHSTLVDRASVQPHYIVDRGRRSSTVEVDTMDRLRAILNERAGSLLVAEPIFFDMSHIPQDPSVTDSFQRLAAQSHLGGQYDWLARYADAAGVRLELAIHVDDKAHEFIDGKVVDGNDPDLHIFNRFEFPVLSLTKLDMARIARDHGFADIMEQTWFCHSPRNGLPCGECAPCRYTIDEGLARRIPLKHRIRARLKRRFGPLKRRVLSAVGR